MAKAPQVTPTPSVSGTSMSSKTPVGVLEDRQSLDWLLHAQSSWKLHTMFLAIFQVIWHHLQVCQEHPCPPRLLLESWRTGRVLTDFYMSNHLEIYTHCFYPSFKSFFIISKCVRNIHVLQDSCWSLGEQLESWLTSTCPIIFRGNPHIPHLVFLFKKVCLISINCVFSQQSVSGTCMSSKTPGGVLEDR